MNPAEERFSARLLKRCRCVCCGQQLVDRVGVFLLVDQQTSRSTRVNFPVARGGYVIVYNRRRLPPLSHAAAAAASRRRHSPPPLAGKLFPANLDEENPSVQISSGLLVQADEGISSPVVDLIDDIYRRLP
ncbi:periodic tryptophan protein 2 [Dorcoceras hygrometricum]|uniref:Periodic tryptophan protein 2 n=1 Tax=Dorcoceras hygrometricum TaxID=472368 RepID=A0A2Z7AH70_9LAMI|nr:periodic tryptophan protein 2 [Dorcoceras hygrometricum]